MGQHNLFELDLISVEKRNMVDFNIPGYFLLENLGGPDKGGKYLTGQTDYRQRKVTVENFECGGRRQIWRFKDGFLHCCECEEVLDIYSYFAGRAEEGAPVELWHDRHGSKNQMFYMVKYSNGGDDWLIIGRKADMDFG